MEFKKSKVLSNERIKGNVYRLKLVDENKTIVPGQFYMLKLDFPILPRPISVCEVGDGFVEFCYITVGAGTEKLARLKPDDEIWITGPIGNGFDVNEINQYNKIAIVTGGIGIAPFVELVKHLKNDVSVFCGFSQYSYLTERFGQAKVSIATENGSEGNKGYITNFFNAADYDLIVGCGPEAFLNVLVKKCKVAGVPSIVSMDKHMACGVGACLVCACKTIAGNKRCCVDGPIFYGDELIL